MWRRVHIAIVTRAKRATLATLAIPTCQVLSAHTVIVYMHACVIRQSIVVTIVESS